MTSDGLSFDDAGWTRLQGGYRVPYDPRKALHALEHGQTPDRAWAELWNELHHQGDVGAASYAAVPHLVRIYAARGVPDPNTYALVALIDECRQTGRNPELPPDFKDAYSTALRRLAGIGLVELDAATDPELVSSIIALLAMHKGQLALGKFAMIFDEAQRKALLTDSGWL